MSTHINAYFMDVEEKQAAFDRASAELDAAEAALEAKKKEVGWVDTEPAEEELPEPAEPKSGNPFKKKQYNSTCWFESRATLRGGFCFLLRLWYDSRMNNLQDRIRESEQQFNQLEQQKQEIIAEQHRLQGEYRVLKDLEAKQKKPNKQATVIEAVPEEVK